MTRHFEEERERYKPDPIRVLFVGDSRPASGHFFYLPDDSKGLRYYTEEAFRTVFGDQVGTGAAFLAFFKGRHCYLDDLCREPLNRLEAGKRRQAWEAAAGDFASRLQEHSPEAMVLTMKGRAFAGVVAYGTVNAGLADVLVCKVTSPSYDDRDYVRELAVVLRELRNRGLLGAPRDATGVHPPEANRQGIP